MAMLLLKASHKEQHSVIHILWAKRRCPNTVHSEIRPVYGDKCFTRPAIHVWCKKFAYGRESVVNEKRPGRCVVSTTDPAIAAVASLIAIDQRVSISVQINLNNMLRNKRLMFEIYPGFIAERIHFLVLVTSNDV